jgi:predicted MFS family arabinose efflux permease
MMQIEKSKRKVGSFSPIEDLRRGLSFSAQHPVIAPVLLLAICGSVFGFNVWTLLPAFADTVLKSPDVGYAALSAANGIGAVLAALLVTRLARRFGRGRLLTTVALFAPFVLLAMALTTSLPVALVITCIAGFSLILQFVSMNTAIQTVVEDAFRGRVMSLYTLTFFGIAPFGALALGVLAERITTSGAIAFCGLVSLALNSLIVSRAKALRQLK